MENEVKVTKRQELLTIRDVRFEVVAWAPSQADVDLSIACMFEEEMPGARLSGGLLLLNEAFGGALTELRHDGYFRGQEMETLLVRTPPKPVHARWILLIGLGNPLTLSSAILERALRVAVREASRLGAVTVAFAPDLLDAGLSNLEALHVEDAMVRGVVSAMRSEYRLTDLGLAPPVSIRNWSFDTGLAHFDVVSGKLLNALKLLAAL